MFIFVGWNFFISSRKFRSNERQNISNSWDFFFLLINTWQNVPFLHIYFAKYFCACTNFLLHISMSKTHTFIAKCTTVKWFGGLSLLGFYMTSTHTHTKKIMKNSKFIVLSDTAIYNIVVNGAIDTIEWIIIIDSVCWKTINN